MKNILKNTKDNIINIKQVQINHKREASANMRHDS